MPPSYRKPRDERLREMNTRRLFTLDSLSKDFSSPEENSFDSHCFQPRKCRSGLPGIQIPAAPRHCPSVWPIGQSLLSSWQTSLWCHPELPTSPDCLARRKLDASCIGFASLPSQRPSSDSTRGFRLARCQLSTCSPLPHLRVLSTWPTWPRTGYQPAS